MDQLLILSVTVRSFPAVVGWAAAGAVVFSTFDISGGTLMGPIKDPNVDEYERKEALRANKRRPIQETIDELGEGRGMSRSPYVR